MSATSGGGGSVSEGSEAGGSSQSTMSVSDSPSTSFQANLAPENVTKITLSEESGAGGYAADVTGSKVNLTVDERQQKDGIVNVAFDYEEGANRGGSGGAGAGDGFRSMNGSEKRDKVPEAVNLELVNMVPYSNGNGTSYGVPINGIPGIPMKKDSEQVDMSTPYDEYFVPVNEHKKYMRGEKLYVTKDKRRPTSWRRCLSWVVACTVISVVLIVAILAGTGVILSQEPDLVKDASVGRNFAGSNLKPSVTEKSLTPTAEKLMYVPRSIESEFVIDNLDFDPALRNLNSSAYQEFANKMEDHLKMFLFDKETLDTGASDVGIKVVNISRDPFKVNYRIGWNYKQGVNNPPEPIKMEDVKRRLVESLARNQGYIDKYHIDSEAIKVNHVINACQMENGGCSHICYYNYISQLFTCTCPTHLVLDSTGKNCVAWSGSSEDDAVPVPSHGVFPEMPYESTTNAAPDFEYNDHFQPGVHQNVHHPHDTDSHDSTESNIKSYQDQQHRDHEPTAEPVPEPTAEIDLNQRDKSSDFEVKPEPIPKSDEKETHVAEHERNMHSISYNSGINSQYEHGQPDIHQYKETTEFEAGLESTATSTPEDHYHNYAVHSVHGSNDANVVSAPTPSPVPTSDSTTSKNHVHIAEDHEPTAEPTPEPAPEPTVKPNFEEKNAGRSVHDSTDFESIAEPSQGKSDTHHIIHSVYEPMDHEPSEEPTPEIDHKATAEPNAESKNHAVHSLDNSKDYESSTEPSPGLASSTSAAVSKTDAKDYALHPSHEFKYNEPAAEPTPEPTPEPTVVPHPNDKNDANDSLYNYKDHKPLAQSTPEPALEPATELNLGDNSHIGFVPNAFDSKDKPGMTTTTEFNLQDQNKNLAAHFVPMTNESAETFPKTNVEGSDTVHDSHSVFASKDKNVEVDQKVEYNLKDKNKELDVPYVYNVKDATSEATVESNLNAAHGHAMANDNGDQTAEHNPKLPADFTPVLSIDNDHQIQMTTSRGGEYFETTPHTHQAQDNLYLGPNFSLKDSNERANSHEGQMQVTEFKTENPNEANLTNQSDPTNQENKSNHTVPYLQDVLIKRPDSDPSNKNPAQHGQDVLQNVERTANGEPIIEEILVEKFQTKNQNETAAHSPAFTSGLKTQLGNEPNLSDLTTTEAPFDLQSAVNGSFNDNSANRYSFMNNHFGQPNAVNETKVVSPIIMEGTTNIPINLEMKTTLHSVADGKEMGTTENFRSIENPTDIHGTVVASNNQNTLSHYNTTANNYSVHIMPLNSDNRTGLEHNLVNLSKNNGGVTVQPEVEHEFHTIPVAVEFSNTAERKTNIESNSKQENHTEMSELNATPSHGEESKEIIINSKTDTFPIGGGLDVTKVQETTTESHIPVTTILSGHLPDMVKMNNNEQLTNAKNNEEKLKEINFDNGTVNMHSPLEANGTTKTPEEFSNNIKDEILDNEEFNTLLGKEYKNKEISSTDGKELLNKYPNKSQKVDKKKIKDYAKGEKLDSDKKIEVTAKPAVTPEDFILQKHVNGHENTFDLEYSLQNEHTTKHDGEVTIIDPHGFDGIPGVSFKPHGINNHDLRVLQTVAPDFRIETDQSRDLETQKPESKTKLLDNKEGEFKQDKDYPKFDKDYKYEKQKVSKKKDLKKKGGSGKDGKNVELDDGRKYFAEVSKEDVDSGPEIIKDIPETTMNPSFEKITSYPELGVKVMSGFAPEVTTIPEYKVKVETTPQPSHTVAFEERRKGVESVTEHSGPSKSLSEENSPPAAKVPIVLLPGGDQNTSSVDHNYHQIVDEPLVKTTSNASSGTVDDGQFNSSNSGTSHLITNTSILAPNVEIRNINASNGSGTPGFVFDGISNDTTHGSISSAGFVSNASTGSEIIQNTSFEVPKVMTNAGTIFESEVVNNTSANPTIIIHGQSGSLQDGHTARFGNLTFYNPGNVTINSFLNGTLNHSDGQSFTFQNYTTFPNGSVVHPTIIVRGQSGTLQDGHEIKFGNATFGASLPHGEQVFKNSAVYRIENGSVSGAGFDKHFDPQHSHYYTFTNSTGTFAFTNATETQPAFIIKGESGDFGNSRAYIMSNDSGNTFFRDFSVPSVIFRNSTVFAVGNTPGKDSAAVNVFENTAPPQGVTLNDTIQYTRQVSPNFFSTGTAYKVNNYFGYISKCAAGQFQCVNGTSKRGSACISLSSKCDSINDCSDGSDELGCIENGCPGNFQCSDGSCLKRNLVCNGILDCSDGSDEKQCESWKCEFDEFQCPSGRCIPVVWQCDGKPDCDNHTDEYNCQTSCGNDEYLCPEGWCVPLTYKCNGVKECINGEDEQLCDCSHEEFKCQTGGCVSTKQVCDGLDDCPDRSDEWDCVKIDPASNLLKIRTASRNYEPVCADNWTSRYSDEVCMSLGYYSSVPIENENSSSITTETSFFSLKNGSTGNFNKKVILNLRKSEGNCSTGKMVEIACQEFTCGSRSMTQSSSVEARLVGGMSAAAGQWPSVALLYNIRNFHSCTANVLTPRWVLASYNCLKMGNKNLNEQDWKFYGGSTVFEAEAENAETRKIVSIIPHPQVKFNQFLFSNDLALVELDQSLHFTSNLGAVCLPEQEMQPRQICVTAGWGMNTPEDKSIRQQLQYLPVPTMNLTECNSTEHYSGFITNDKICAGYNSAQKSLCYNEEGAPLMCVNDRGEWELQGVLSYHSNCGRGSHPSIFSSITPVADWIRKTIGNAFERKTVAVTNR